MNRILTKLLKIIKNKDVKRTKMSQTAITGKELLEEDSFWAEGSFIESISPDEFKQKDRTIHMKPNNEENELQL